jgi:hypothetical protein
VAGLLKLFCWYKPRAYFRLNLFVTRDSSVFVRLSRLTAEYASMSNFSMDKWRGKVALVTGASAGIGAATAVALANSGVKVAVCARRVDKIEVSSSNGLTTYNQPGLLCTKFKIFRNKYFLLLRLPLRHF